MISKRILRGLIIFAMIPAGWIIGFFGGYYSAYVILCSQGKGNSHNDMITVVSAGGLGAAVCALIFPIAAWLLIKRQKK